MALFTIIFQFRRRDFAYQVEGASVMDALRHWITELDTERIPSFGNLSKKRLTYELERTGPTSIAGMECMHTWHGGISGYATTVYVVETERSGNRSKPPQKE